MGLSSAIDWWNEWKLRILVLCSLFVHFFLFFSVYVRRSYALRRLRALVWLAYIGGDAMAVYALATLFNRQKQQHTPAAAGGGGGSALEVTWAPVLLNHLGGQIMITAYSLEDNELWKRHAITLVSQVTVALYVFCQWWSGDTRLLVAAVLLFIVGILKFSQKPWALRMASYGNMAFVVRMAQLEEKIRGGGGVGEKEGTNYSLEEYVKEAQEHVKEGRKEISGEAQEQKFMEDLGIAFVLKNVHKMFLDLAAPYSVWLRHLRSFLNLDGRNQHLMLQKWIHSQFISIYTRATTTGSVCSVILVPGLTLASVVLFAKSDKDGYDKSDITVTYILFCGMFAIELAPFFLVFHLCPFLPQCTLRQLRWQDMVAQHNVMSFCARKKKPPTLMKIAATFSFSYLLRDFINKHWYIRYQCVAQHISVLVRRHAEEDGWKEYVRDAATYRRFNNLRGEYTVMKMNHQLQLLEVEHDNLGWTFNLPFDEYVLLWHLATDLCIHQTTDDASASEDDAISSRRSSEIISNYMIYLLFICPEMLIPGARHDLFILACDDIERMIKDQPMLSLDERSIAHRVLCMGQDGDERMRESGMISNAYRLSKALTDLNSHGMEMWEVIQGVWVEMLCYSASRSRGYQHAKNLAYGGEFLTNVWLLWWFMGMQTLPDMMNNLGPPEELSAASAAAAASV